MLALRLPSVVALMNAWYESPRGPSSVAGLIALLMNAVFLRIDTSAATAKPPMFLFRPMPYSSVSFA